MLFISPELRAVKPQERMWMWLRVERRCWTESDSWNESSGQQCCKHEGRWLVLFLLGGLSDAQKQSCHRP
jgi:hypothetical protein